MDELRQSFESIREKLKDLFNRVNQLEAAPTVTSGSGGGAPVDAQYLTLAFNATLTQERRLDFSARFAKVDGGAGADYDVDLAASGVGAGVYGSATQVPQITVDTYGRLTNAANIAISGVPPVAHPLLGDTYHNDVVTQGPTRGSLIYGNATPKWDELVLGGITGSVLTRNATDVLWSVGALSFGGAFTLTISGNSTINGSLVGNITGSGTIATGGFTLTVPATGTAVLGTGTTGYVAYWNGTNTITGEAQLFYDFANNRLGINDATPSYTLDLNGIIGINGSQTIYNAAALGLFIGTMYIGNGGASLSHTGGAEAQGNTAVGADALLATTTGYHNSVVGDSALRSNTTGHDNVCIGMSAGYNNLSGINNVLIGNVALYYITASSYNVALGYRSGMLDSTGGFVNATSYSTFVGNDTRPLGDSETNQIVIGSLATGKGSNTATIGTATTTDFYAFGNHIIEEDHFIGITGDVRFVFDATAGFIKTIMGDAAGADEFQIVDSGAGVVFIVDSNGVITSDSLTASTVIYSNASKEIVSLANATGYLYNNGAGVLSYVAGVVTGSGVANRVTYWTAADTIGSDAGLTVDAANDMYLVENAGGYGNSSTTARLMFDSSGATDYAYFRNCNVGIGTATPQSKLSLGQNSTSMVNRIAIYEDVATGHFFYGMSLVKPSGVGLGLWGGSGAAVPTNTSMHVFIENTGNVGIATGTPATRLHTVYNTATTNAILEVVRVEAQVTGAGVSAAGFGPSIDLYGESATKTNYRQMARVASTWTTATDATRTSNIEEYVVTSASLVQISDRTSASQKFGGIVGSNYLNIDGDGDLSFFGAARIDWTKYTANSVTLSVGKSASGVADLRTHADGLFYHIDEAAASPAINLIVDFISVTAFNWVQIVALYQGGSTHAVAIQLYNWNTTAWDTFNACQTGAGDLVTASGYILNELSFFVPSDTNYIRTGGSAGQVRVRFYHTMLGNASHDLDIDVVALYQ